MTTFSFDTHAFVKRLTTVGMPEPQAEVLADALAERPAPVSRGAVIAAVQEATIGTNRRIDGLERRLTARIDEVEQRLGARIDGVEQRIGEVEQRLNARIDGVEQRLGARIDGVEQRIDGVKTEMGEIRGLLVKILEGQSVLHQNDMELKRRFDERQRP